MADSLRVKILAERRILLPASVALVVGRSAAPLVSSVVHRSRPDAPRSRDRTSRATATVLRDHLVEIPDFVKSRYSISPSGIIVERLESYWMENGQASFSLSVLHSAVRSRRQVQRGSPPDRTARSGQAILRHESVNRFPCLLVIRLWAGRAKTWPNLRRWQP